MDGSDWKKLEIFLKGLSWNISRGCHSHFTVLDQCSAFFLLRVPFEISPKHRIATKKPLRDSFMHAFSVGYFYLPLSLKLVSFPLLIRRRIFNIPLW